ncbi:MAG: indole-3-glycerol phosphate synthase TrpC [Chlorobiaceae bacterium]|nr:indole-3-glycerol phosphate synthase TrpC [Chlorobiaceae bacterium]NTV16152.1 indole-3-glycerol phosphate synthase TrpC [Chlorobiaceae bacterium]
MTYLSRILEEKKREIEELEKKRPARQYDELQDSLSVTRDFTGALRRAEGGLRLIAEIKKASPSRGLIVSDFDPLAIAGRYKELGAAAYSVLTDRTFFQGSADYLQMVSRSFPLPVLRKDFIIDETQIFQSRLIGADAILLIVAALDPCQLGDYLQLAESIGLHVLVEVHDRKELDTAVEMGALIIGVNNRDLKDFSLKLETSLSLRPFIPSDVIAVSESGMKSAADIALIEQALFDAVLIGEGLHTSPELSAITWS